MSVGVGPGGGKYGFLPWTDEELFRDQLARVWIYDPDRIDWSSFPESAQVPELIRLLGPIAALQLYGLPGDFERRREAVAEALGNAPLPVTFRPDPQSVEHAERLRADQDAVLRFCLELKILAGRMRHAERELEKEHWKLNPDTRRVERDDSWNRPTGFRRRIVVAIAKALREDLQNDQALREEVAEVVGWWLSTNETDPSKDGPIDRDLKNELTRRAGLG